MTIQEAVLKSLKDLKIPSYYKDVYQHIIDKKYYTFNKGKTPDATISAYLGDFIRSGDTRVKRIKGDKGVYLYYLSALESELDFDNLKNQINEKPKLQKKKESFYERDLHSLLSSYLHSVGVSSKTIYHENSKNSKDKNQKWAHPDMVGIKFMKLKDKVANNFMKIINKNDVFEITSYELKKEINTDYELKRSYFQAVSNSSWANYGYLVAFEISSDLMEEMKRLNNSFGIGIIELRSNPFQSKVLFQAKLKDLDFNTIDKLCKINPDYKEFIKITEKLLSADDKYVKSTRRELDDFCDSYFDSETESFKYCESKNIPIEKD